MSEITQVGRGKRGKQAAALQVTVTDPDGRTPPRSRPTWSWSRSAAAQHEGLDLERAGMATNPRGWVEVDDRLRTNVPGVHAIGDVTGRVLLAHVASHQGLVAAAVLAGHDEQ